MIKRTLLVCFLLAGCGNFSLSDLSTGAGSVVGAGAASLLSSDPLLVVGGAAVGAIGGSAAIGESTQTAIDHIQELPEEDRAAALRWISVWDTIRDLGYWSIFATLAFFLIPMVIGYVLPNGRQRKLEKMVEK